MIWIQLPTLETVPNALAAIDDTMIPRTLVKKLKVIAVAQSDLGIFALGAGSLTDQTVTAERGGTDERD